MLKNFVHFTNSLNTIYCSIRYIKHNRMITVIWKGTAPYESIKQVKDSLLEMIRSKDCIVIMNDVQELFSGPADLVRHLGAVEWDEEVSRLGVKYLVHVLKPDTQMPEDNGSQTSNPLEIKYFHNKMDAVSWIKRNTNS